MRDESASHFNFVHISLLSPVCAFRHHPHYFLLGYVYVCMYVCILVFTSGILVLEAIGLIFFPSMHVY